MMAMMDVNLDRPCYAAAYATPITRVSIWPAAEFLSSTCSKVTTRFTKVDYLMYLGNSDGVLLVLILSCCEDESMLLA
jgi:hypothetical protein